MRFTISSLAFHRQLSRLKGVVPSSPVIPILATFHLECVDGELTVTASDLKITVSTRLEIDTDGDFNIAIPAKILLDTLKNLPEQPVTFVIDLENNSVQILSQNGQYKVVCENGDEFPKPPRMENTKETEFTASEFLSVLNTQKVFMSKDDLKLAMNGVNVQFSSDEIAFCATDSHRLSKVSFEADAELNEGNFTLPTNAVTYLSSVLKNDSTLVSLAFSEGWALFQYKGLQFQARLLDEAFPNYKNILPTESQHTFEIDRKELTATLKRLVVYTNNVSNQVRFNFKVGQNEVQISAEDIDFANEAQETLMISGAVSDYEIGFNAKLLMEVLGAFNEETLQFSMNAPNNAVVIHGIQDGEKEESAMALIMPLMLPSY